jgi:hypothetical protein
MAKKSKSSDINVTAHQILQALTGEPASSTSVQREPAKKKDLPANNPAAVALGRLGGLKGGRARADSLTPKQRKAIAKKAAESRWANKS